MNTTMLCAYMLVKVNLAVAVTTAAQKAVEEAAAQKAVEEVAAQKAVEEAAAQKAVEEAAAKKVANDARADEAAKQAFLAKYLYPHLKEACDMVFNKMLQKAVEEADAQKAVEEAADKKEREYVDYLRWAKCLHEAGVHTDPEQCIIS